jgi:FkbM family methyltransferase
MPARLRTTNRSDGTQVLSFRPDEAQLLHRQVLDYFGNGITLRPGNIIFDVGANIGLFSLYAARVCGLDAKIYAFEPVPAIFEVLRRNLESLGGCARAFPFGLWRERTELQFSYCVNVPSLSTAYPWRFETEGEQFAHLLLRNLEHVPSWLQTMVALTPARLRSALARHLMQKVLYAQTVHCQTRTLSEVIREQAVERIDLLKIDVEKSEFEVLLGIEAQDWPKIQQVVAEIHDLEDRVVRTIQLLKMHGFQEIGVAQEGLLAGSDIYYLYARR